MDASASSRLSETIRQRDLGLVINTPEEADFWYAMDEQGLLESFFDFSQRLTLEKVLAIERARALAQQQAATRRAV